MKKKNEPLGNSYLNMNNSFITDDTLSDLFNITHYVHFPEITDDLVLVRSREASASSKNQTLFIYKSGDSVQTNQPLNTLYDHYGTINEIEEWLPFQKTMAYLIKGAVQFPPYATLHSVFLKTNSDQLINLNHISGFERSKVSGQTDTHTDVTLSTGAIVEIYLGYKSFRKKFHEGALILIALRKLFRFTYNQKKMKSIYDEPSELNPFLVKYLKENNLEGFNIPMTVFKKTYGFFETIEKQLRSIEITPEVLEQFDDITKELIINVSLNKKNGKGDF